MAPLLPLPLLLLFSVLVGRGVLGTDPSQNHPGIGYFENELRAATAAYARAASPIDLRVAKGLGSRGYDQVRISVVSQGTAAAAVDLRKMMGSTGSVGPVYNDTFRYRWRGAFDLGVARTSCGTTNVYNRSVHLGNGYDADCMLACTADFPRCGHYTYFKDLKVCELAGHTCSYQLAPLAEATYKTAGLNVLASAVATLQPGRNVLRIAGQDVEVSLPRQGGGVRGVVVSDPCYSSRWVGCAHGLGWDAFNRTITLFNALAAAGDLDFFAILGDNFYDQDGRLTKAIWDRLSLEFKSRFLMTMPGNHDIWVPGGPPGDQYDQYSWGLQQFYGQDTLASVGGAGADGDASPFDFSGGGPDEMQDWSGINNHANNSFFYHILGNLGFIGYNGGATAQVQLAYFKEACAYMGSADPAPLSVVLLGHWNDASSGCPAGADVPEVHQLLTTLPGCEALRIRYMDGHTHCNHAGGKEKPNATAGVDGFMIGGHGMSGYRGDCAEDQFGFALLDSTANSTLRILYFEERSESKDSFETILECVRQHGASGCAHMATVWL